MSCYHPLYGRFVGMVDGKKQFDVTGYPDTGVKSHPYDVAIPCGHCIGCRLDYSRSWADRMMLELDHDSRAVFVTLTYDNDHVPIGMINDDGSYNFSLNKRDCQLFMKRVRKHFDGRTIRFYLAGEYGTNTLRPHYHAILFGLSLYDFDLVLSGRNEFGQPYYSSELLSRLWDNGFTSLSHVSWQTCAYVARYCTKKVIGNDVFGYAERNVESPFALMSRRPGIAGYFADDHSDQLDQSFVYINDQYGLDRKSKVSLPKYLFNKLELINPDLYDSIKSERKRNAEDRLLLQLQKTSLGVVEYRELQENNKLAAVKALKRGDM